MTERAERLEESLREVLTHLDKVHACDGDVAVVVDARALLNGDE